MPLLDESIDHGTIYKSQSELYKCMDEICGRINNNISSCLLHLNSKSLCYKSNKKRV